MGHGPESYLVPIRQIRNDISYLVCLSRSYIKKVLPVNIDIQLKQPYFPHNIYWNIGHLPKY